MPVREVEGLIVGLLQQVKLFLSALRICLAGIHILATEQGVDVPEDCPPKGDGDRYSQQLRGAGAYEPVEW